MGNRSSTKSTHPVHGPGHQESIRGGAQVDVGIGGQVSELHILVWSHPEAQAECDIAGSGIIPLGLAIDR